MTYHAQKITAPDGTALVVITEADYRALIDAADIMAADRAVAESDFTIPSEVVDGILAGATPIAAWRVHRDMTQDALAKASGMLQPALARVEARGSKARKATLEKLADALQVPVWALEMPDHH
ncbi:helix-turn-helix domain-containing protein [Novosphingobium sp. Leaf2]|uniref:helix-turn-helix domain-containing protein n=1 Tax=Novosphingobium sp. Leaf2 TaxID=1735670 RepID=UPI0006F812B6|nr:helix-turn-helix transcriptional regulator [Novosphingobium sp. Leaf2]KQM13838.1 hypothetical protein ASE49_12355 [Novosphingobium sp. Leaf2]